MHVDPGGAGTYKVLASGQVVALHPSSVLCGKRPACIVYDELLRTTRDYARQACLPPRS